MEVDPPVNEAQARLGQALYFTIPSGTCVEGGGAIVCGSGSLQNFTAAVQQNGCCPGGGVFTAEPRSASILETRGTKNATAAGQNRDFSPQNPPVNRTEPLLHLLYPRDVWPDKHRRSETLSDAGRGRICRPLATKRPGPVPHRDRCPHRDRPTLAGSADTSVFGPRRQLGRNNRQKKKKKRTLRLIGLD